MTDKQQNFYTMVSRFWEEALRPAKPMDWSLSNTVTYENDSLKLRCFIASPNNRKLPILLLAPNAGHHLNIAEPLIKRCMKNAPDRALYVVDWLPPTAESLNKYDSMSDIIRNVTICADKIGNHLHLFTLCQGAWVGAIYASLYPDKVVSYTNGAGPIDFLAGGGKIKTFCEAVPMSFFENLVQVGGGVERGEFQLMGFKNMNPYERYFGDYLDLWLAICNGDEGAIKKWHRFKDWYDQTQNLAGVWYLEAVDKLFKRNLLVAGELEILGQKVDLHKITCPVFLIAGDKDDITPPPQVFNMEKYVSGTVKKYLIPGTGHIGVFTKESSLDCWEQAIIHECDNLDSLAQCKSFA
ncbi:MAG TPA: DUF3141 domain-containing protein [Dehalococcoidales bacterium]|nr:DUF3141 domain-containing protein [Dehalococcoidales bacterium]